MSDISSISMGPEDGRAGAPFDQERACLLYTSDAADE